MKPVPQLSDLYPGAQNRDRSNWVPHNKELDRVEEISFGFYPANETKIRLDITNARLFEWTQRREVDMNPQRGEERLVELRQKYLPKLTEFRQRILDHTFPPIGEVHIHVSHPNALPEISQTLHKRAADYITIVGESRFTFHIRYDNVDTLKATLAELLDTSDL
jgi:hypothetical protein